MIFGARQDIAAICEPVRDRLWQTLAMMIILLFGAGTGIGLIWRHQHVKFYREKAATADTKLI